ncbi:MFS transporter [Catellatospora methionotrophica]|uniref:MFS transporter n=1 Tax=Catellatospora methionotrophica TaxID=121620 RepID=A0A8J3LG63_9ACTN|nr:MFS transporter [Catellatospora methionotrophica]GIG17720.1 MFS transporter [Catellatospora methionotrophica]
MRGWLTQTTGGLPKIFWYLWTGTLINRTGAFVMLYLEIHMVVEYGFSATFAGLVLGLFGGGMALGSLAGGVLADRWGRRSTLLVSNLALAATAVVLGFVFQPVAVALLAAVYGFWNGLGRPAFSATMVDVLGPTKRMRGMNLNYWAINLGFSFAAVLAGVLSRTPHLTVFLLNAAAQLTMAAIVFWRVPETRPVRAAVPGVAVPHRAPVEGSILIVLRDRVFMTFVLLNLGLWIIIESCKLIPIAMHQRGLDAADYGTVIAVNGIMIVAFQLFVPKLLAGRNRSRVLALSALLVGLGMGATAIAGTVPALMLTVVVWTAGEMLNAPVNGTLIADLSQPAMRGRYQGVASMGFTAANFFAPVFGGMLLDHAPPMTLWLVLALLGVAVATGQLLSGPVRERRARALTEPKPTVEGADLAPVAA